MPRIFITSGTLYTLPNDFNPSNNTIECYGGGAAAGGERNMVGGGGGAYAKSTNVNIGAGAQVQIQIGSGGSSPGTDTFFNATSLANAVSKGATIACGAQGGNGQSGGAASSSCGGLKYNGGAGQGGSFGNGGGGGGGAAGPNGAGAVAGMGTDYAGGGGGGANGGSSGSNSSNNNGGPGGNGRSGTGGGAGGTINSNGGNGTAGGGGGGGGNQYNYNYTTGGTGGLDNVYGDGIHGPGGGGGAGSVGYTGGVGGNGGGFGAGGGGAGAYGPPGSQSDGLIVITYVSAQPGTGARAAAGPILSLRPPSIFPARAIRRAELDASTMRMGWYRQPSDTPRRPPIIYRFTGPVPQPAPNVTPKIWPPHLPVQALLRHPVTLDYRQQFPGQKPPDFSAALVEGADTVSSAVDISSPINAALLEHDTVVSTVSPLPELGGSDDIIRRVKLLLPKGWWNYRAPIRDAIIGGVADGAAWCYSLIDYAKMQTRVAWAQGVFLDIISKDYFGFALPRRVNELDENFRARIQKELIRERVTRKGMVDALTDLTGQAPYIFEPWNTGDAGAWDVGNFALDAGGGWGETILPAQSFVNVVPPGAGIPMAGGWDSGNIGFDADGMWGDMDLISGTVTDQDIYDTINKTRPTGSIVWTQLFPPAGPMPIEGPS